LLGPTRCQLERIFESFFGCGEFRADIQNHDDIRADRALDLHAELGREHELGAVDMGLELNTLLR
jgi:hypothetical protein